MPQGNANVADVAELADALDSGSSGLIHTAVEVRPLSSAFLDPSQSFFAVL